MELKFIYLVQQWERKSWRTKFETVDFDFACEKAQQRAIATKERVRVIRVETWELFKFN